MRNASLAIAAALLLAGCANRPPPPLSCGFKRYQLGVPVPPSSSPFAAVPASNALPTLDARIRTALAARQAQRSGADTAPGAPAGGSALFLSGGGQNGAFGAGFLDGWGKRRADGLPDFDVVTGVSTGAIQASWAFADRAPALARSYAINREADLLDATGGGAIAIVRNGAVANLDPLRDRLHETLTDDLLGIVAMRAANGALLVAGVVEVDSGEGLALDLGDMAVQWQQAPLPARAGRKACYIEAILASASAPLAAPPVFIDNVMYIDGGARFGSFSDQIDALMPDPAGPQLAPGATPPTAYLIVNGTLGITAECGKAGQTLAGTPPVCTPPQPWDAPHKDWDILSLGLRSVDILQNQVARFSAQLIAAQVGDRLRFVRIEPDADGHAYTWPLPLDAADTLIDSGMRSCAEWRQRDDALDDPVQFHPRYMRCLIDYGRGGAGTAAW